MFSIVDILDHEMMEQPFGILIEENLYQGADLDLQIYPSTLAVSFSIPSKTALGSAGTIV